MDEIICELKKEIVVNGDEFPYLNSKKYRFSKVSKENFNEINTGFDDKNVFFIDGGHQEILSSNSFCVSYNKLAAIKFFGKKKKEMIIKKFWTYVKLIGKDNTLFYSVKSFSKEFSLDFVFDAYDSSLALNGNRASPQKISGIARKISEIIFAKQICEDNRDSVIVLDGILLANIKVLKESFDGLYSVAKTNNNVVCSLAKTSNLVTRNGKSLLVVINNLSNNPIWSYKIAESLIPEHNVDFYLVKLHGRSNYIFRFEIGKEWTSEIDLVLSLLKNNSVDPVFLGYPYGLVVADDMARVSDKDVEYYRTMLLSKAGKDAKEIISLMKDSDAHSVLDKIKF